MAYYENSRLKELISAYTIKNIKNFNNDCNPDDSRCQSATMKLL